MLVNTEISFALKNAYGQYEVNENSIFQMEKLNSKFSMIKINTEKNKTLKLEVKCPICSEIHSYSYNLNDILRREVSIGGCESAGTPLFYIGNHQKVNERIQKLNYICSELYAML